MIASRTRGARLFCRRVSARVRRVSSGAIRPEASGAPASGGVPVRRVLKAYEQIADQLRELITSGTIAPGERLPNEATLARQFGVSRATVRESLRVLSAQNLVRTAKGSGGGSYVTLPTVDHISEFLGSNFNLMTAAQDVSLEDLLEARMLLEVPAARLAAERRSEDSLARLQAAVPEELLSLSTQDQFAFNRSFHSTVLEACGNKLLYVSAQPIFSVLQRALQRSHLSTAFHRSIDESHRRITAAIEAGDPDAAEREMRDHLEHLRPEYERTWRLARSNSDGHHLA
jgi:GntR family transcriptional repressor for pyruvate dehydrogenase complex